MSSIKVKNYNCFKSVMSYVESAVYWYIRNVTFAGLKLLFNRKNLPLTILLLAAAVAATVNPNFVGVEAAFGLALIFGHIWLVLPLFLLFFVSFASWSFILPFFYIVWLLVVTVTTLLLSRDFVASWAGYIFFFGEKRGRVPFAPLFNLLFLAGIIVSVLNINSYSLVLFAISLFMTYIVNAFAKKGRNNLFATVLSIFYVSILYNFLVMQYMPVQLSLAFLSLDSILTLFALFFMLGVIAKSVEARLPERASVVLSCLGLFALFHASVSNTDFLLAYHTHLFVVSAIVFAVSIVLFNVSIRFMSYFSSKPSTTDALKTAAKYLASEMLGRFIMKVK
jgi:hypothetical protein